jgi:hypothetical protein
MLSHVDREAAAFASNRDEIEGASRSAGSQQQHAQAEPQFCRHSTNCAKRQAKVSLRPMDPRASPASTQLRIDAARARRCGARDEGRVVKDWAYLRKPEQLCDFIHRTPASRILLTGIRPDLDHREPACLPSSASVCLPAPASRPREPRHGSDLISLVQLVAVHVELLDRIRLDDIAAERSRVAAAASRRALLLERLRVVRQENMRMNSLQFVSSSRSGRPRANLGQPLNLWQDPTRIARNRLHLVVSPTTIERDAQVVELVTKKLRGELEKEALEVGARQQRIRRIRKAFLCRSARTRAFEAALQLRATSNARAEEAPWCDSTRFERLSRPKTPVCEAEVRQRQLCAFAASLLTGETFSPHAP